MKVIIPVLTIISLALLNACSANSRIVRDLFSLQYDCDSVEVESMSKDTYQASGCGRIERYRCKTSAVFGSGYHTACVQLERMRPQPADPRPRAASSVKRIYDEEKGIQAVKGVFPFSYGDRVILVGAPEQELGTVMITLSISAMKEEQCVLEALVNEKPHAPDQIKREPDDKGSREIVRGSFDFQIFKPLAQRFSTFELRFCGRSWKFHEQKMDDLRKFMTIYSEIAIEMQQSIQEPNKDMNI